MVGRVKWFNTEKGYGFIIGEDNNDYFFHVADVKDFRMAENGDKIEFEPTQGTKGKKAVSIKVIEKMDKQQVQRTEKVVRVIHEQKDDPDYSDICKCLYRSALRL